MKQVNWLSVQLQPGKSYAVVPSVRKTAAVTALQEKLAGNTAILAFALAVVFVFLLLAALYESWLLPFAVVLIVPMCILAAMTGVEGHDGYVVGDRLHEPAGVGGTVSGGVRVLG